MLTKIGFQYYDLRTQLSWVVFLICQQVTLKMVFLSVKFKDDRVFENVFLESEQFSQKMFIIDSEPLLCKIYRKNNQFVHSSVIFFVFSYCLIYIHRTHM